MVLSIPATIGSIFDNICTSTDTADVCHRFLNHDPILPHHLPPNHYRQIQDTGNGGHYPLYYLFLLKAATHLPEIRRIEIESGIANIIPLLVGSYFKHDPKEKRIELTSFIHVTIETAKILIKGTVLLKQIEK